MARRKSVTVLIDQSCEFRNRHILDRRVDDRDDLVAITGNLVEDRLCLPTDGKARRGCIDAIDIETMRFFEHSLRTKESENLI